MRIWLFVIVFLFSSLAHANTRDGLVGWWRFDEAAGNAIDSSGNGNTGTLVNAPTRIANCPRNNCFQFNGTTQDITASDNGFPSGAGARTLAMWVKPTSNVDFVIFGYGSSSASFRQIYMGYYDIGSGRKSIVGTGGVGSNAGGNSTINVNAWTHLAATYDGTTWTLYVNGANDGTGTPTTTTVLGGTLHINDTIGTGTSMPGYIDDVRIYNRALSAQEIQDLYNSGIREGYAPGT